ncbi:hypothetical protein [Halorubrum persicum]|uniref:hypothetical protein n=1 Tax=Halorubrum persicum TaxID=1383844 RepID=UPI0015D4FB43|nr:hypothetical protein [Halorubrum persicum]
MPDENSGDDIDKAESTDVDSSGDHLSDIRDGVGCTEIWEHLSDERNRERPEGTTTS